MYFRVESAEEEKEVVEEVIPHHPMVTITKIDPDEIPDVSNKFLMRDDARKSSDRDRDRRDKDGKGREGRSDNDKERSFGWSKNKVPNSRSGRTIKGRGVFVSSQIF